MCPQVVFNRETYASGSSQLDCIGMQFRSSPGGYAINQLGVGGDLQPMTLQNPGPIGPAGVGGGWASANAAPVVPRAGVGRKCLWP